jgi:hypothetical protein
MELSLMFQQFHPILIIRNPLHHQLRSAFQIEIGGVVIRFCFEHLLETDRGLGEFFGKIELQTFLKVFRLI